MPKKINISGSFLTISISILVLLNLILLSIVIFLPSINLDFIKNDTFNIKNLAISFGGLMTLLIYHIRNQEMHNQTKIQYEIFNQNRHFESFLEATKMLTDEKATIDAKISALYLLYDVAKSHPENLDRIIQVINKQLTPLLNCIEDNCNIKPTTKKLILREKRFSPNLRKDIFKYTKNDVVNININDIKFQKTIKEWQYNGNDTEKLISVSLYILKKIVTNIVPELNRHVELSNTVIFDLDTDFDKNLMLKSNSRPIENLIFLNCKLHNIHFQKTIYHQSNFINCDLANSDFTQANLWGALFENCDLKDVKFNQTKCEAVEFKNCENLTKEQIEKMKFKNKTDEKKYLIILPKNNNLGLEENFYFTSRTDFNNWRYPSDSN